MGAAADPGWIFDGHTVHLWVNHLTLTYAFSLVGPSIESFHRDLIESSVTFISALLGGEGQSGRCIGNFSGNEG